MSRSRFKDQLSSNPGRVEVTIHPSFRGTDDSLLPPHLANKPVADWTEAEKRQFKTGYEKRALVNAAYRNGELKGNCQKPKKDRMNHGIRYSSNGRVRTGKASRNTGVFLGEDSQHDDSYRREMRKINRSLASKGQHTRSWGFAPSK